MLPGSLAFFSVAQASPFLSALIRRSLSASCLIWFSATNLLRALMARLVLPFSVVMPRRSMAVASTPILMVGC